MARVGLRELCCGVLALATMAHSYGTPFHPRAFFKARSKEISARKAAVSSGGESLFEPRRSVVTWQVECF